MASISSADPVFSASVAAVVSRILASGANVTLTPFNGQIQIAASGGGSSVAAPGLIPDLMTWWATDDILVTAGNFVTRLRERTPWIGGVAASNDANVGNGNVIDSNKLNSLPIILMGGSNLSSYVLAEPFELNGAATIFVVMKPNAGVTGALQAILGGATNSLALYLNATGSSAHAGFVKTGVSVMAASTASWSSGVAFQFNATYTASSGAYAYRQARAAAGSGTTTTLAGTGLTQWVGADSASGSNFLGAHSIAELIVYNRVLTNTEITTVETYLNAKWGV